MSVAAEELERRLSELDGIGVGPDGVSRLAWTDEAAECQAWFERQASAGGLAVEVDPAGNLWALPDSEPPWWGVGSHLDSVRGGGRFDGPLGVVAAFEVVARFSPPVAVISFADEEGARFNTPTFGSKALAGKLDVATVLGRSDEQGLTVAHAMLASGVDPAGVGDAPSWLGRLTGFIEIHIDQSTDVARAGAPVGIVSALANRLRVQVELRGRADHAGTTPRAERRDALVAAARLIVAADELATDFDGMTVTTARIVAEPNAPTTIASLVRVWIDARTPVDADLDAWLEGLRAAAGALPIDVSLAVASRSAGATFPVELRGRLARVAAEVCGVPAPEVVCYAGHDAGVLAERIPAAMVLVRNETGVSHSPAETVDLADAAVAVEVVARALAEMA